MTPGGRGPLAGTGAPAGPKLPRRGRTQRIRLVVALLFVVVAEGLAAAISFYDWNRARDWLGQRASEAIGRKVEIRGHLALSWARAGADDVGIARFLP